MVVEHPFSGRTVVLAERSNMVSRETSLESTLDLANEICMIYRIPLDQLDWYERDQPVTSGQTPKQADVRCFSVIFQIVDGRLDSFSRVALSSDELATRTLGLEFAKRLSPVF
ncbi:MAG: hypothetical protein WC773_01425 [Patescibacteria group bacterium]